MKKKKVLFVATVVKIHIMVFHVPFLEWFKKKGYEVHVAARNDYENKESCNIPFCDKYYDLSFERQPFRKNNIKVSKQLEQIINDNNYDIIHCHTPMGGVLGRWAARKSTSKVVYTAHGFHFYKGAPLRNWLLFYPVERFLANYTDTLITINKEDFYRARDFNVGQLEYVRGVGIDLNKIKINKEKVYKLKYDLEITGKNFVLCSVGELNHNKNHSIVFEALNQIKNKNIKYLIIGSGELEKELMMEVKRLELENQVIFLGFRDDIYELLSLSDVFVFPSFREGLSKSLMEAMAVGKPVIASNIRGNKDLINNDEGGLLFDPKNAIQLSESIMKMLNDESFRNNASAINMKKIKLFSLDNILERMSEIYQ